MLSIDILMYVSDYLLHDDTLHSHSDDDMCSNDLKYQERKQTYVS